MQYLDQVKGSLYGIAIGDALGVPLVGSLNTRLQVVDMIGGGPNKLEPGQWTDKTDMTLCLLRSVTEHSGYSMELALKKYLTWWSSQEHLGLGKCCERSFYYLSKGDSLWTASRKSHEDNHGFSAGSGALMRCAPLAYIYHGYPIDLTKATVSDAKMTHWDDRAGTAALVFNMILSELLKGENDKYMAIQTVLYYLQGRDPQVDRMITNLKNIEEDDLKPKGFVLDALQLVLWYFINTEGFEKCLIHVINRGGCSDTTGSLAGALAGAYYGFSDIPKRWIESLNQSDVLQDHLKKFLKSKKEKPHRPYC